VRDLFIDVMDKVRPPRPARAPSRRVRFLRPAGPPMKRCVLKRCVSAAGAQVLEPLDKSDMSLEQAPPAPPSPRRRPAGPSAPGVSGRLCPTVAAARPRELTARGGGLR